MKINSITPAFKGSISTTYETDNGSKRVITFNTNSIAFSYGLNQNGRKNGTIVYHGNKEFFVPHSYQKFSEAFIEASKGNETHIDIDG